MEKISLEMMFDAMNAKEHKEVVLKGIDKFDEEMQIALKKYLEVEVIKWN